MNRFDTDCCIYLSYLSNLSVYRIYLSIDRFIYSSCLSILFITTHQLSCFHLHEVFRFWRGVVKTYYSSYQSSSILYLSIHLSIDILSIHLIIIFPDSPHRGCRFWCQYHFLVILSRSLFLHHRRYPSIHLSSQFPDFPLRGLQVFISIYRSSFRLSSRNIIVSQLDLTTTYMHITT